jgi:hypothetical protein
MKGNREINLYRDYDLIRDREDFRIDVKWGGKMHLILALHSRMSRKLIVSGLRNLANKIEEYKI